MRSKAVRIGRFPHLPSGTHLALSNTCLSFRPEFFDDMSTQITVELLIRPGSRVPVKIARQLVHDDQIIAVAPIRPPPQYTLPPAHYANGQSAAPVPSATTDNIAQQSSAPIPTGPARGTPREPAHNRQNGAPSNPSAPSKPRGAQQQQQNGAPQPPKHQNNNNNNNNNNNTSGSNNANYNKNTSSAISGKSLLQRMNIGLAERISGAPVPKGNPPTEPASSKKNKKQGGAGAGPVRPNAR
jgi:hypothetical protein